MLAKKKKDGTWEWNLFWRRNLMESELALASNFMAEVEDLGIQPLQKDI